MNRRVEKAMLKEGLMAKMNKQMSLKIQQRLTNLVHPKKFSGVNETQLKKQELVKKRNTAAAAVAPTLSLIKVNRLPSLPAEVSMADIQEKRESVKSP